MMKNKDKFEFKFGGRDGGQTLYAATKLLDYINSLEPHKIYAISNLGKGVVILSKNEMVFADTIKQKIKEYDKMIEATYKDLTHQGDVRRDICLEIKSQLQEILQSGGIINEN